MKKDPKVSIITPSFNQGQFIGTTIQSVLSQTYSNIQYIIVDGGSTDNTMEIVNKYKDKVDIIISEKDKGQSHAINKGFKLAEGELVGWINSDDILYSDCVKKIVDLYLENPNGSIYYGAKLDFINDAEKVIGSRNLLIPNRDWLLNNNYDVIQPGSFYSNKILKKCEYLDEDIHYCMDLDLWLKLLKYSDIFHTNKKPLAAFRRWEQTKTATGKTKFLNDIRKTLLKHNCAKFSPNIIRIYWKVLKHFIKIIIGKK